MTIQTVINWFTVVMFVAMVIIFFYKRKAPKRDV